MVKTRLEIPSNCEIAYITNDWGTRTVAFSGYNAIAVCKSKKMMIKLKERFPHKTKIKASIRN